MYFVLLDFLNIPLPWKNCKDNNVSGVKDLKEKCLKFPEKYLWNFSENLDQVKNIFFHLKPLEYSDKPDYAYIKSQLQNILQNDFIKKDQIKLHPQRKKMNNKKVNRKKTKINKRKKIEEKPAEKNQSPQILQWQPPNPQNRVPQQNINFNINQFSNQIINSSFPIIFPPINTNYPTQNSMQSINLLNYNFLQSLFNNYAPYNCGIIPSLNVIPSDSRYSNMLVPIMPNPALQINCNSNLNINPSSIIPQGNLNSPKKGLNSLDIPPSSEFQKIILPSIDNLFPIYKACGSGINFLNNNRQLGGDSNKKAN